MIPAADAPMTPGADAPMIPDADVQAIPVDAVPGSGWHLGAILEILITLISSAGTK